MRPPAETPDVLGNVAVPIPPHDPDAEQWFEGVKVSVSDMVEREAFATWWRPARGWCFEDGGAVMVVALPSPQFVMWWRALYVGHLVTAARECGREGLKFRLIVVEPDQGPKVHGGAIR